MLRQALAVSVVASILAGCATFRPDAPMVGAGPKDLDARVAVGRRLVAEGNSQVEATLDAVLAQDPGHVEAHVLLALAAERGPAPDWPRAVTLLERAVALDPAHGRARVLLGQAYEATGRQDQAVAELTRALALARDGDALLAAHLSLMSISQRRGDVQQAEWHHAQARQLYPEIDRVIEQAEIASLTPGPVIDPDDLDGTLTHPPFEERVRRAQRILRRLEGP
jgi:Flp pilus assembly protein TadD